VLISHLVWHIQKRCNGAKPKVIISLRHFHAFQLSKAQKDEMEQLLSRASDAHGALEQGLVKIMFDSREED